MSDARQISHLDLEKLYLGELEEERMAALRSKIASPNTRDRLLSLRVSNDAILADYPPRLVASRIEERVRLLGKRPPIRSRALVFAPALATAVAAAVLIFALFPETEPAPSQDSKERIITKGPMTPALLVFRKSEKKEEYLTKGESVRKGDVVQLKYNAKGAAHGVIFSIDGRGTVTLHHPSDASGSTALKPTGNTALDFSYELDDAPGFERFFFVTSDAPLNVAKVLEKAKTLGAGKKGTLPLEAGLSQCDFVLLKSSSRM